MSSIEFVSLAGPDDKGGVGPTINWIVNNMMHNASWIYFSHGQWMRAGGNTQLGVCDASTIAGHHRYVHEFLWPLLIGMPELAAYSSTDDLAYWMFNNHLGRHVSGPETKKCINDHELSIEANLRIWHGPMPGEVPDHYARQFNPFIESLLRTESMVFHTTAFLENLLQYVAANLCAQYKIDWSSYTLTRQVDQARIQLFAFPLGVDADFWSKRVRHWQPLPINVQDKKVIFLVGRCDPAKAWESSLEAIERLLHRYPQRDKILVIVQCGRIHEGLDLYDQLWDKVQQRRKRLEGLFGDSVAFIDNHLSTEQMAWLYGKSNVLLVAPWKDGQPLTAKEYVACQNMADPHGAHGVVLLSTGTGVWHEFRDGALEVNPNNPTAVADKIIDATEMNVSERRARMRILRREVVSNSQRDWWHKVSTASGFK